MIPTVLHLHFTRTSPSNSFIGVSCPGVLSPSTTNGIYPDTETHCGRHDTVVTRRGAVYSRKSVRTHFVRETYVVLYSEHYCLGSES